MSETVRPCTLGTAQTGQGFFFLSFILSLWWCWFRIIGVSFHITQFVLCLFTPVSVLISITAEPRWLSFNKQRVIGKSPVDRDKLGELSTRWDLRSKYSNLCPSSCDVSKSSKFADKICAFNISLCCSATQKRKERNQHCWRCQWGQCWPQTSAFPVVPAKYQNKQILISTSFCALSSFYVLTCRLNYMSQPMLWAPKYFTAEDVFLIYSIQWCHLPQRIWGGVL